MSDRRPRVLSFPAPTAPWGLNDRAHWTARRGKRGTATAWRMVACQYAKRRWPDRESRACGPATVWVHLPFTTARRRDPHNFVPCVKAIVDGLVDAGVWPDDTPEWVRVMEPELVVGPSVDPHSVFGTVVVVIEPWWVDGA